MAKPETEKPSLPELLAPAGSLEAFHAGFEAGADAFYMGLGDFNARRRAKNFTEKDLIDAAGYAHLHGRKVYVTLNTLVFDDELPALMDALALLEEHRADGLIVQDLGVMALAREHFPSLPVHASTQMFCHNSMGASFLKQAGAERIILARELSLNEISSIMEKVPLDYEVFIHGAMCFSFSGCCLYSSYFFGDSGNRGRCRQPCRLPDESARPAEYPFSMRDLSAGEHLRALANLGVRALKIEGRLKNAEYVYKTVSHYRRRLDAIAAGGADDETPGDTGARETARGYFHGADYRRLVNTGSPGTVGEPVGEVLEAAEAWLLLRADVPLRKGMKLRVTDARGRGLHEGTLLDYTGIGKGRYRWKTVPDKPLKGKLLLFQTGTSGHFSGGKEIAAEAAKHKTVPASLMLRVMPGRLEAAGAVPFPGIFAGSYELPSSPARSAPLREETVREMFLQSDKTPFSPKKIEITVTGDPFVPLSALKQARRDFYRDFHRWYDARRDERNEARKKAVLEQLRGAPAAEPGGQSLLFGPPRESAAAPGTAVVDYDFIGTADPPPLDSVVRLPLFVSEDRLPELLENVRAMVGRGHGRWMLPSHGWTGFFREFKDLTLIAGPLLYCVNFYCWRELRRLGVTGFTVSPDMPGAVSTRRLPGYLEPAGIPRELMATRLRLPRDKYRRAGVGLEVVHYREYDLVREE